MLPREKGMGLFTWTFCVPTGPSGQILVGGRHTHRASRLGLASWDANVEPPPVRFEDWNSTMVRRAQSQSKCYSQAVLRPDFPQNG